MVLKLYVPWIFWTFSLIPFKTYMVLKQNTVLELVDFSLIPFKTYMVLKLPGVDCQSKLTHFYIEN